MAVRMLNSLFGGPVTDIGLYAQRLKESEPLREPALRSAIRALALPAGSRGLDVGCGIGFVSLLLAETVGSSGQVTGLDTCPEFLVLARQAATQVGLSDRVTFREGSMHSLPFQQASFEWVWSADCVGYPSRDPVPLLQELARVVKPGGLVSFLIWSHQQLLPGYPLLEARLNATTVGMAPFAGDMRPGLHPLRALGWLREAGLAEPSAQAFAGSAHAPLSDDLYTALASLIEMRWPKVKSELSEEDWQEHARLCHPESPDFILSLPDYYGFFVYTLFCAKVP
jgi:demethylmenaquinone methyltransferase/2-methoxy-6-polyprenyl-1,4-benzoquinol methylase